MNRSEVEYMIEDALTKFNRYQHGSCYLTVEDNFIIACPCKHMPPLWPRPLVFSESEQTTGITSYQWDLTLAAIIHLYNKEKACQEHQKH